MSVVVYKLALDALPVSHTCLLVDPPGAGLRDRETIAISVPHDLKVAHERVETAGQVSALQIAQASRPESAMPRMCPPKTYEESSSLTRRLAKAVLQFQDRFMDLRVHSGSLCQVRSRRSSASISAALAGNPALSTTACQQQCYPLTLQVWLCDTIEAGAAPLLRTKVSLDKLSSNPVCVLHCVVCVQGTHAKQEDCTRQCRLRSLMQGLPFCVSGIGDLLALFRCISCRYTFSTNAQSAGLLGAPGRVVTTGEVGLRCLAVVLHSTM